MVNQENGQRRTETEPDDLRKGRSDLHLSNPGPLQVFDRPFADVDEMNRHLLAEWRGAVAPDYTIICLGDVAHRDAWRDPRLMLKLRDCSGRRILVEGDRDTGQHGGLWTAGFERRSAFALYAADPPLASSHEPSGGRLMSSPACVCPARRAPIGSSGPSVRCGARGGAGGRSWRRRFSEIAVDGKAEAGLVDE